MFCERVEEILYALDIKDPKSILAYLIRKNGDCVELDCKKCPIFSRCAYNMFDNRMHYERAKEKYIELYGEDDLVEELL